MIEMDGYVGKILKIDLGNGTTEELNTEDYVPELIGGFGVGLKLVWDNINEETTEYDPENPLVFCTGPAAGTPAPSSGRGEFVGLSPKGYPEPWVAHSGIGGDLAWKMKSIGYDAVMVTGKADEPVYLVLSEDEVEIKDASNMWGLTTLKAQDMLLDKHGDDAGVMTIGPAGENLVRWSVIESHTENAAGHGGMGALMGSKNLKAYVFKPGTTEIGVAKPDKLIEEAKKITEEMENGTCIGWPLDPQKPLINEGWNGRYTKRTQGGCTSCCDCASPQTYFEDVPQHYTGSDSISGVMHCVGSCSPFMTNNKWSGKWQEVSFEINKLTDMIGIDQWEAFAGIAWFIQNAYKEGEITELMGHELDLNEDGPAVGPDTESNAGMDPGFAVEFLKKVAYREGEDGDLFAEGARRVAEELGIQEIAKKTHGKHGYPPHWDGRYLHFICAPLWVVNGLIWAFAARDPCSVGTHGFGQSLHRAVKQWGGGPIDYEDLFSMGKEVYGTKYAATGWKKPENLYRDKEIPAIWHEHTGMMKCSIPVCDWVYPMTWSTETESKAGDYEAEVRLFNAIVGTDWSYEKLQTAAERVVNLRRSIHVLQGRTRENDECVIDYFQQPDMWPDDNCPDTINPSKFRTAMDRYYEKRGWDKETGWPTKTKLEELGLNDVADGLEAANKLP
ncbi:MAG: Aldehyde:ferredoxin oxidoreductase [Candidatus Methanohalarchaeum thermophilum]|uniref:Aldehyde:ferredoxin oxidoreductase n=1 Tax=Methanohalarchaeum thermophilum TaxID=1903181 RepID=A0A1Q6DWC6_METT1|nr:MAG: Aldehyde:ferredoxin oxidoreductase [Candidatus Methanohalarchaeum thermophilum]